jgi:diaminopimelate epimerase
MRIFNPDGTEASMCGNGIRCLAWYAVRSGITARRLSIETKTGVKRAEVLGPNRVRVQMGRPRFLKRVSWPRLNGWPSVDGELINSGVPHLVCWVENVKSVDVEGFGGWLRWHRRFQPQGTNVDFVERMAAPQPNRYRLKMRTYERGVEGETRACGTGAVAAAAALLRAVRLQTAVRSTARAGQSRAQACDVEVQVPGGVLRVVLSVREAFLEGPVRRVSTGSVAWPIKEGE